LVFRREEIMKQGERNFRFLAFVLAIFAAMALVAGVSFGQTIDGDVVGTIADATSAVVGGADVTATNVATNVVATTKTDANGDYHFAHLLAGTYKISAKMTGFKTITEQVEVQLNKTTTRNLTLTPGATSETIEVSGTPPTIDTTTSQLQTTYDNALLQVLPSAMSGGSVGGGVLNASLLEAGVASTGGLGAGSGPSVGGQRPRENNFTIEGEDNNAKSVTGPLVYIPNDAVANFTVITNQFSPEFGHSAGGQFNQVVLDGTNTIHGMAYEYFRNRDLNAVDYSLANQGITTNPRYDNNRFGGQVGGPILKNKVFYFVNFELNPLGQASSPSSPACAPTAAGWATIAGLPLVNQNNVAGFSKYATAPSQASTTGSSCLGNGNATVTVNDYSTPTPTPYQIPIGVVPIAAPNFTNGKFLTTSGDWDISDKDQLHLRYIYNHYGTLDTGAELGAFFTPLIVPYHLVTAGEYHTFSPNIINEFRIGYTRTSNSYTVPNFAFPGLDAFPNLQIDELDQINVGPDPSAPQYATENTYQLQDNFSWNKGKHSFKFGVDLRRQIDPQKFIQRSRGDYEYGAYTTADGASGLDAFVNDFRPTTAQRSFGSVGYSGDDKMYGWYVNDIWKITRNLSLNLGLRYEYLTVPAGWAQQTLNAVANDPGLITFGAPTAPKKDFMPRIGFAYSPGSSGNTSIRGGFSMAYDVLFDNIGTLERPPEIGSTTDCSGDKPESFCGGTLTSSGFLAGGGIPPQPSSGITQLSQAQARAATSAYLPTNVQYPYAESWNLGIQHVFGAYTAEVRYLGSRGVHLDLQTRLNAQSIVTKTNSLPTYLQAPSQAQLDALTVTLDSPNGLSPQSGCATALPCVIPAPYLNAGFTTFITAYEPWGWSTYHGLQTQLQRKLTHGLQFQAAWTWSHEIDNSTADFFSTVISPRRAQDFGNYGAEKANGLLDHAHRITIEADYEAPWFAHDSNWVKKNVLGNFQFIPVYTWETGQWGTVQSGDDANLNFDAAPDRAILNPAGRAGTGSGVSPLCSTGTNGMADCNNVISTGIDNKSYTVAYLATNPNAQYIQAGPGAYATSSRGNFKTPPINNFDMSAIKHFKFGERFGVQFIAQSFNVLNHPQFVTGSINDVLNFSNTSSRSYFLPGSPIFNNPKQNFPSNARTMQLALKFTF
jgi:hypothetical protein